MESFSFSFENWLIGMLFFFGGCMSFKPPAPMEITGPTETTRNVKPEISGLIIEAASKNRLRISYKPSAEARVAGERSFSRELLDPSQPEIEKTIRLAINTAHEKSPEVNLKNKGMDAGLFKKIVEALRSSQLIKYKLITTPE